MSKSQPHTLSSNVGPTIRKFRKEREITLDRLAELVGTNKSTLSKLENGRQSYTGEQIEQIAEALGVNAINIYERAARFNVEDGPDLTGTVPLISWVQAGFGVSAVDNLQPGEGERIKTTYPIRKHTYALRVRGDSMEPKFPEGCIVIVEPEDVAEHGKFVIVRRNGDEPTLKQYIEDGGAKLLKPLNSRYPISEMRPDDAFCGVVKFIQMPV